MNDHEERSDHQEQRSDQPEIPMPDDIYITTLWEYGEDRHRDRYVRPPVIGMNCGQCRQEMEWEECETCGGNGGFGGHEIVEEDVRSHDPDAWEECEMCKGDGGWWHCSGCNRVILEADLRAEHELTRQEEAENEL